MYMLYLYSFKWFAWFFYLKRSYLCFFPIPPGSQDLRDQAWVPLFYGNCSNNPFIFKSVHYWFFVKVMILSIVHGRHWMAFRTAASSRSPEWGGAWDEHHIPVQTSSAAGSLAQSPLCCLDHSFQWQHTLGTCRSGSVEGSGCSSGSSMLTTCIQG